MNPRLDLSNAIRNNNNSFINQLWELAENSIGPLIYSNCLIYGNAQISDNDIEFLIDTGCTKNMISRVSVERLNISSFVDRRTKCHVEGITSTDTETLGTIPYIEMKFGVHRNITCASNFLVLETLSEEMILSLPFLLFYQVKFDFGRCKMNIMNNEIDIRVVEK